MHFHISVLHTEFSAACYGPSVMTVLEFCFVSFDYNRVLKHFFWPGMKADVVRYYTTCHNYQIVWKLN